MSQIDRTARIHPTAHIGDDVVVGRNVVVGPHAVLDGDDGEGYVDIGDDCVIGPGCMIGQVGFGYVYDDEAGWMQKPHSFGVRLHRNVQVGANTCIDRGSWRTTVIGTGAIIDNLVHIAHNAKIGGRCAIVAQAEISGSVELGYKVYVGPCASIRERLKIGQGSIVGMGAVVTKDVDPGMIVAGIPARVLRPVDEWPPPPPDESS